MTLLFIFDMDDVLYDYDWRVRMAGMSELTGYTIAELRARWWHDTGEWAAEAIDEHEWVRIRAGAMTPFPDSLAAVRRASQLGQVTLLTNNGPLAAKHLRTLAPELVDLFGDHLFTSSDYGARKPDPAVFERVLESYGVEASRAFFADDLAINVEGAASVGITTYRFGTPDGMLAAIEEFARTRGAERAGPLNRP